MADFVPMVRLDETMWSYKTGEREYRVLVSTSYMASVRHLSWTPSSKRLFDYRVAQYVLGWLNREITAKPSRDFVRDEKRTISVNEQSAPQSSPEEVKSRAWDVTDITNEWVIDRQKFPLAVRWPMAPKTLKDLIFENLSFCVLKIEENLGVLYRVGSVAAGFFVDRIPSLPNVSEEERTKKNITDAYLERTFLNGAAFTDAFTVLAKAALERDETPFISEKVCTGSSCFVLDEKMERLMLVPIGESTPAGRLAALKMYVKFIKRAFQWRIIDRQSDQYVSEDMDFRHSLKGYDKIFSEKTTEERFLGYLKCAYGIDFEAILLEGEENNLSCKPLYPDHVFKCNIAANHVSMDMLESLFFRLSFVLKNGLEAATESNFVRNSGDCIDPSAPPGPTQLGRNYLINTVDCFQDLLKKMGVYNKFSLREIRGFYLLFRNLIGNTEPSIAAMLTYLGGFKTVFYGKKSDCLDWNREWWDEAAKIVIPLNYEESIEQFDNFSAFYERYKKAGVCFGENQLRQMHGIFIKFTEDRIYPKTVISFQRFLEHFDAIFEEKNLKELAPKIFRTFSLTSLNELVDVFFIGSGLFNSHTEPKSCFTGRDITHLSICGFKTQGNLTQFDPSRNLFELMHTYPDLQRENAAICHELFVHVVVKKSLWADFPLRPLEQAWERQKHLARKKHGWKDWALELVNGEKKKAMHTGQLIPFSSISTGKKDPDKIWYYVDGVINDGGGNLNYVLLPVARRYTTDETHPLKELPLIKLYRSTASDPEAVDAYQTVLADMNPSKIGSLNFGASDEEDLAYFNRCTMPIWVGYLIIEDFDRALEALKLEKSIEDTGKFAFGKDLGAPLRSVYAHRRESLKKLIAQQKTLVERRLIEQAEVEDLLIRFFDVIQQAHINDKSKATFEDFQLFISYSLEAKEWDVTKVMQDIYFMGHSLGGVFTQDYMKRFFVDRQRIPLKGCNYKCFLYDSPGTSKENAKKFIEFGQNHQELLIKLEQKWEIAYQFEKEDAVALGGEVLLGAYKNFDPVPPFEGPLFNGNWLKVSGRVCTPLPQPEASVVQPTPVDAGIVTMSAHGRRFSLATEHDHYSIRELNFIDLNGFKPVFSTEMRNAFGFQTWNIPQHTELMRKVGGALNLAWPPTLLKIAVNKIKKSADREYSSKGVMAVFSSKA